MRLLSFIVLMFLFSGVYAHQNKEPRLNFTENIGQWEQNVLFKSDLSGYAWLFAEGNQLTYLLKDPTHLHGQSHQEVAAKKHEKINWHAYRTIWLGSNKNVNVQSEKKRPYFNNYFRGNDPSKWKSEVGNYAALRYTQLYNGIDFLLYSEDKSLKSDYIIHPGADVAQIKVKYDGVDDIKIDENGLLKLKTSVGEIAEFKPLAYQIINGQRKIVACQYQLKQGIVSFHFPDGYDLSEMLIIDPTLIFSTYSGSPADNWGSSATHDAVGNMFLGGIALDPGYPVTTGAFQTSFGGGGFFNATDVVITKFTANGRNQMYSTYLGGSSNEMLSSLYCTPNNELIALISTSSSNFPVASNGYDRSFNGGSYYEALESIEYENGSDIAIIKLNATGSALVGGTFYGGTGNDGLNQVSPLIFNYGDDTRGDIAVDPQGNIYIVSTTTSSDLPGTSNRAQPTKNGGTEAMVAKFNSNLSALTWATYFGGSNNDAGYSIQLDKNNNVFISGGTVSNNLPATANGLNPTYRGGDADGFLAKINANGNSFLVATYLGTSSYDQAYLIDTDKDDNVYVFGQSLGAYPVSQGVYSNTGGKQFIHKLNATLNTTGFSTVFGRTNSSTINISPTALLVDVCSNIYAVGWGGAVNNTGSTTGMAVTSDAFKSSTDGSDFYMISLAANASSLVYASYFGESGGADHVDGGTSRFDKNGIVYQAVCASCGGLNSFPVTQGAYSEDNLSSNCNMAGFKFQFDLQAMQILTTNANPSSGCGTLTTTFNYTSSRPGTQYLWNFGDGTTSTAQFPQHTYNAPGTYTVKFILSNPNDCNPVDSSTITVVVRQAAVSNIQRNICQGQTFTVGNQVFNQSGNYSVKIPVAGGCDSTVNLALTVNPVFTQNISRQICTGQSITIGNQTFNQPGNYTVKLSSSNGCDSTVNLALSIVPVILTNINDTICEGDSIKIGNQVFKQTGNYSVTLQTSGGCDSTVNLALLVNPLKFTNLDSTVCEGEFVTVGGQNFNQSGDFVVKIPSSNGCDSTISLKLTVLPGINTILNPVICEGDSVQVGNQYFKETGTYAINFPTGQRCDSIVTLNLTVNPVFNIVVNRQICQGQVVTVGTQSFDQPGNYVVDLLAQTGCDSTVTLNLAFADSLVTNISDTICQGSSVTIGQQTFSQSGNYTVRFPVTQSCDSIVNLSLTVLPLPEVTATATPTEIEPGESVEISATSNNPNVTYQWLPANVVADPNAASTTATVQQDTWLFVTVTTAEGCSSVDSVLIDVVITECNEENVFIPNTFTPNGDGKNDVFRVRSIIPLESMTLIIYNRWGEKIFESNNQNAGWDGTFNGELAASDAYGFYFSGKCGDNIFERKGKITLLR